MIVRAGCMHDASRKWAGIFYCSMGGGKGGWMWLGKRVSDVVSC